MEKHQIEALITLPTDSPIRFKRHRRSHLNSETFRTLSRILNCCYDYSQSSLSTPVVEEKSRTENNVTTELEKSSEEEVFNVVEKLLCEEAPELGDEVRNELHTDEMVVGEIDRLNDNSGGIENIDTRIDEKGNEIGTEGGGMECNGIVAIALEDKELNNGEASMELNDMVVDNCIKLIDTEDKDFNRVQMKMNEFECIMSGERNVELVTDNCDNLLTSPFDNNETAEEIVKLVDAKENYSALENFLIEESGGLEKLPLDDQSHYNVFGNVDSLSDIGGNSEILEVRDEAKRNISNFKTDEPQLHELQQKAAELEKSICISNEMVSSVIMDVNEDIEEGELSDDLGLCDLFVDIAPPEDKNVGSEEISEDVIKEIVTATGKKRDVVQDTLSNVHKLEISDDMDTIPINPSHKKIDIEFNNKIIVMEKRAEKEDGYHCMLEGQKNKNHGDKSEEALNHQKFCRGDRLLYRDPFLENTNNGESASTKEDVDVCKKKKRAGSSQAKKEKAKKRKRQKRAEQNKQNGVKRLKLQPVVQPKTLKTCDHYLKGRCRKGADCTFSHDAVPLTKSTPCSYFARKECMKGDDCPYDHELSKYPCTNFVSSGSCIRGDTCLFSHKVTVNGSTTTPNIRQPEFTPPLQPGSSNSKKQQTSPIPNKSTGVYPWNNTNQNSAKTFRPPAQPPKGMNFLSFGKSPLNHLSQAKQGHSSPNGNNIQPGNQMNPSALSAVQSLNELQRKIPPTMAPKGINPFSVGTAVSSDGSLSKKQVPLPPNSESCTSTSPLNTSSNMKSFASPLSAGFRLLESQTMHERQKKEAPALTSPGINPFSLGIFNVEQKTSLPFKKDYIKTSPAQNSSPMPAMLSLSSLPPHSQTMHEIQKKEAPALTSPGINPFSLGNFNVEQKISLPLKKDNIIKISPAQNSSPTPAMLSVSSLPPTHSLSKLSDGLETTTSSAQKSLLSTLAFAAKYEPKMKMR